MEAEAALDLMRETAASLLEYMFVEETAAFATSKLCVPDLEMLRRISLTSG
jgi:hypothetical protein